MHCGIFILDWFITITIPAAIHKCLFTNKYNGVRLYTWWTLAIRNNWILCWNTGSIYVRMLSSQKIFEAEIITITSKIGIDKNQLSVNSRENSKTFPKIRGTALVTLNKVGGNPVSYNIFIYTPFFSFLYYMCSYENCVTFSFFLFF